ncbi:MAG: hypothetical protein RIS70_2934, partial [Planctomycetota bacterium]
MKPTFGNQVRGNQAHQHRLPIRFLAALVLVAGMVACNNSVSLADDASSGVMTWTLRDEFRTGADRENPNRDHADQPTWHFLRTNSSNGPVESRQWLR